MPDRNRKQKVTVWELNRQAYQLGVIGSPFEVITSKGVVNSQCKSEMPLATRVPRRSRCPTSAGPAFLSWHP